MAQSEIRVLITGDASKLDREFKRASKSASTFDKQITAVNLRANKTGQAARGALSPFGGGGAFLFGSGAFVASAGITAGIAKSVDAASDLNETISKSRQVFGEASAAVEEFGNTAASSIGVSKQQAIEAAATFGNLFRTVGLAGQQNAELSSSLVKLAADLASFNNVDPSDSLLALRSGLIGEAEPLRRFGVLLSEARVQQVALANTGKTTVKSLTDQEKVLARYQIILKDTASAQGDFARTSEGLANQTRTLKANLSDLAANMGGTLLPAVNASVGALNDLFETGTLQSGVLSEINSKVRESGVGMTDALPALEAYRDGLASIKGEGDILVQTLDAIIQRQSALAVAQSATGPENQGGPRGPGAITQSNAEVEAAKKNAREQRAQAEAVIAAIARQVSGQKDLNKQLSDSEKRAAHLRDLIREDPDNARLQARLRAELEKQVSLREQIAAASARAAGDSARAAAAAKDEAAAIALARKEREREAAIRRITAARASQFQALGLTAEGEERIAGIDAIRRRGRNLIDQLKGSGLEPDTIQKGVKRISAVFSKQFDGAGRDVRAAILRMFQEIANALNAGGKNLDGPLTKTSGLNTKKFLAGLGLSAEEVNALRGRLSSFNSAGVAFSSATSEPSGSFSGGVAVDNYVTVQIGNEKLTGTVTREQQKARRRNPKQKRGPNRNR